MLKIKAQKIPLYKQIKENIKRYIVDGIWPLGYKLPAERKLAEEMGVSRKTVSLAYKELQNEGYISSHRGKGTFVIRIPDDNETLKYKNVIKDIDKCLEKCMNENIDFDKFIELCKQRVVEYKNKLNKMKVLFLECNKEQLDYFTKDLEKDMGISITPMLLQDYKDKFNEFNLTDFDLIVTTLFHADDVKNTIKDEKIKLLPIGLMPKMESIIKLAKIPETCTVGILSITKNFATKVKNAIYDAGIKFENIIISTTTSQQKIKDFVNAVDAIIVSPSRKKYVEPFVKGNKNIIEFVFVIDAGSKNLLKYTLKNL